MNTPNSTPGSRNRATLSLPSGRGRPITVYWIQAIGRRPPRVSHHTREAATAEALRLSTMPANAGVRFQVRESRYVATFCDGAQS